MIKRNFRTASGFKMSLIGMCLKKVDSTAWNNFEFCGIAHKV